MRPVVPVVGAVVLGLSLAACGASPGPAVTVTTVVTSPAAATSSEPATTTSAAVIETTTPAETTEPAAEAAAEIVVPNGVGMDYQSAQDVWRAAGLHVAPATDATGRNRIPIIDSNWVVLSQDLKAGSSVPADSFITATVKKFTD